MRAHNCLIAIGSNLGDRELNLILALEKLNYLGDIQGIASLWESEPAGLTAQPSFLNSLLKLRSSLGPFELLREIKEIEFTLGRRPRERWGPREIDIDIIDIDNLVLETEDLVLPHPRIAEREFVLKPLEELDPNWTHPVLKLKPSELLKVFKDKLQGRSRKIASERWERLRHTLNIRRKSSEDGEVLK